MSADLEQIANRAVSMALDAGATDAECTLAQGDEFSVSVRLGEVESLKEAGSSGAGIRILVGNRAGSAYTSDLGEEGIRRMVHQAMEIAEIATEDPYAGLPETEETGPLQRRPRAVLRRCCQHPGGEEDRNGQAGRACRAQLRSPHHQLRRRWVRHLRRQSRVRKLPRVLRSYRSSSCSLSTTPVARDGSSMERDYWYTAGRTYPPSNRQKRSGDVRPSGRYGASARGRLLLSALPSYSSRELRARCSIICSMPFQAALCIARRSFLADKLGQQIAAPGITVIDDATMPRLFGSSPFDDEGVPSRAYRGHRKRHTPQFLLNTYSARRLGMKTTGNGSRGLTGNAGVGHGNFYLEPGERSPEEIIRSVGTGLYVTELIGFGVNVVTGDYSRGAAGLWIENGELAYPVSEIAIASTLQEMLMGIEAVGSDLEFRSTLASPTLLIREMTISGRSS